MPGLDNRYVIVAYYIHFVFIKFCIMYDRQRLNISFQFSKESTYASNTMQ